MRRETAKSLGSDNIRVITVIHGCSSNRFRIFQADLEGEQLADVGVN